jgi:hypothetical protein
MILCSQPKLIVLSLAAFTVFGLAASQTTADLVALASAPVPIERNEQREIELQRLLEEGTRSNEKETASLASIGSYVTDSEQAASLDTSALRKRRGLASAKPAKKQNKCCNRLMISSLACMSLGCATCCLGMGHIAYTVGSDAQRIDEQFSQTFNRTVPSWNATMYEYAPSTRYIFHAPTISTVCGACALAGTGCSICLARAACILAKKKRQ